MITNSRDFTAVTVETFGPSNISEPILASIVFFVFVFDAAILHGKMNFVNGKSLSSRFFALMLRLFPLLPKVS